MEQLSNWVRSLITVFFTKCYYNYEVNEDEMGGYRRARTGEKMSACWVLVGKHEEKKHLERCKPYCKDNIRMDFIDIRWDVT
jgi:hypothetical protein